MCLVATSKPEAYSGSVGWGEPIEEVTRDRQGLVGSQAGNYSSAITKNETGTVSWVFALFHILLGSLQFYRNFPTRGISCDRLLNAIMFLLSFLGSNCKIILDLKTLHSSSNPVVVKPGGTLITLNVCVKNESVQSLKRFWLRKSGQAKGTLISDPVPVWIWPPLALGQD